VEAANGLKILPSGIHEITAGATMNVDVDKAGRNIFAGNIDNFQLRICPVVLIGPYELNPVLVQNHD
jgi:hypothetical protein